jgi:multiple sugar transport system substrate-binding protein
MRKSRLLILLIAVATLAALVPLGWVRPGHYELLMTVWGMPFEDYLFRDIYARGFEELHPEVRVNSQRYLDVMPKYQAWHVVGRGADVMRLNTVNYRTMVDTGMLEPLNRFIQDPKVGLSEAEIADFFPEIWEALHVDGEVYALPSDHAEYGLFFNKAIFDAYNADHPADPLPYPSAAWTWADLSRAAEALTRRGRGGQIEQYGIAFDLWSWPFLAFFRQAGGVVWDAQETTTLINSDAGVEAVEFLVSLIPKDAPLRSLDMAETASGPDDLFKLGKVAMLLDGSWRVPDVELHSAGLDFAISPLPRHRRRAVPSGSVCWGIGVHSRHKEKAWEMVKWLVAYEQSLCYWDTLRVAPPAQYSVVRSEAFQQTAGIVKSIGGADKVLVPPMPRELYEDRAAWLLDAITPDATTGEPPGFVMVAPYERDLELRIAGALVQAVRGERTPREALDAAARDIHEIIDRDRAAKGLPAVVR